jgi:NADH-quinone oxidoreductase subunit G
VLNTRIRKVWRTTSLPIGVIGEGGDLTYRYEHLGRGPETLAHLSAHAPDFYAKLLEAERPLIVVGQGAVARPDGLGTLGHAAKLALAIGALTDGWNGFAILHTAAGRVGALDAGALPGEGGRTTAGILSAARGGEIGFVYLLGVDEIDMAQLGEAFVVYQGSHGDKGAHRADVILPGAAYTEKSATYVNTEGRPQLTRRAIFPPGGAREDWAILRALSEKLGARLPFDSLEALRGLLYEKAPQLAHWGEIEPADPTPLAELAAAAGEVSPIPFASPVEDFYLTNPIARASRIMAECSALRAGRRLEAAE